jgi:squalene-hopene/tetraprenyl-beta-curcumene cyclase
VPAALLALLVAVLLLSGCARSSPLGWRPTAAARYLDQRTQAWLDWSRTARGQGTACVSCHTALPYALVRGDLGRLIGETAPPLPQQQLLQSVRTRVRLGTSLPPYYGDSMTAASRGTEAVLNALILARQDQAAGSSSAAARTALERMWALQRTSGPEAGSWDWLQFNNEPWEAPDSVYYGAALAALATGSTPAAYRDQPSVQAGLARLRDYLLRAYSDQPLLNRIDLLWAAQSLPGLIPASMQRAIIEQIWRRQGADGGWNTAALMPDWKRRDGTAQAHDSDGYATGLISLVLQQAGTPPQDARLQRALGWLRSHQSFWSGRWSAVSLNRRRGLRAGTVGHFMDDAATAYAVMALTRAAAPDRQPDRR